MIAAGYSYSQNLPASLLGSKELWIQARLLSHQGAAFSAQFLRYDPNNRTNNCFDLAQILCRRVVVVFDGSAPSCWLEFRRFHNFARRVHFCGKGLGKPRPQSRRVLPVNAIVPASCGIVINTD